MPFPRYYNEMKRKLPRVGFELGLPIPFSTTLCVFVKCKYFILRQQIIIYIENTWANIGYFLYKLDPDIRRLVRRLEPLHLKILKKKQLNKDCEYRKNERSMTNFKKQNRSIIEMESSSSSCRAASMDIPDPLSQLLPIIHRLWQVFRVTSCVLT